MKKIFKYFFILLVVVLVIFLAWICYFFLGSPPVAKNILWGVDYSQMQAESLKLNWKETYLAILENLGAKNIKLHTQWDFVEGDKNNEYYFDDIDWQLQKAKENKAKIIYVLGMKTGRWPECHIPNWVKSLPEQQQKEEVLQYIKEVVLRYKNDKTINYWQVENEPFFAFGECPAWYYNDKDFLEKEISLVKSLDSTRPIIVTDSGEISSWFKPAKVGDVVGITMYRKVWMNFYNIIGFPMGYLFTPMNYWRRAEIIKSFFKKDVICIELQAEPWLSKPYHDAPIEEQLKSMNLEQFKKNISFAKQTGIDKFYLWGVEWWYWLKTTQNQPQIWLQAKTLFQ